MSRCPRCSSRKGKRHCPALGTGICPQCCAGERLKSIACPQDCPHLAGEIYQHHRRREKARSRGREFVEASGRIFATKSASDFAFKIQADIYYFAREHGPVADATLAGVLDSLRSHLSKIFVPPEVPHPILAFLIDRLGDSRRYPVGPGFTAEDQARALTALASYVRSLAGAPTGAGAPSRGGGAEPTLRHHEVISSFFGALDFEADLDYSPQDPKDGGPAEGLHRSAGGLILPA